MAVQLQKIERPKEPLSVTHPGLAAQWHPTKNGDLRPEDVTAGSHKKVWWKCPKGDDHEWEASIASRARGTGCPCCRGLQATRSTCLTATHSEIAKEWHPTKNGDLTPADVTAGSNKKVWWQCSKASDHEWEAIIANWIKGCGCPWCSNRRLNESNCLAATYPEIAKEWHPTKNGDLTPSNVAPKSGKRVWWQCDKRHEWQAAVSHRVNGTACPICSNRTADLSNCLASTHSTLAAEWHPKKNGSLTGMARS
jgi:hypothetical protein